jgi:pectate lyase
MSLRTVLLLAVLALFGLCGQTTAGPGRLEGFGAVAAGRAVGAVRVEVTSTGDRGRGTLREALSGPGPRRVVFVVGGTITLTRRLEVQGIGIVIDGATAPAPGITLAGEGLAILDSMNVVVRDLRVRRARTDGIAVTGSTAVVIDHCSISDAGDENVSVTEGSRDVTVSWSIIGDTRRDPAAHAKGMLVANFKRGPVTNVTIHHNLFVGESQRNPQVSTAGLFDMRNNVVRDWFAYGVRVRNGAWGNIVNNTFTSPHNAAHAVVVRPDAGRVWIDGNAGPPGVDVDGLRTASEPFPVAPVETQPAEIAAIRVRAEAGARPRDATDTSLAR